MHSSNSRPDQETILIVDFGSQYSQLIARRVREANIYCELAPWDEVEAAIARTDPRGLILSGGPASVYDVDAPTLPDAVLRSRLPILGICYGMQVLAHRLSGQVAPSGAREYGPARVQLTDSAAPLFADVPGEIDVWMSHGDRIDRLPPGWQVLGASANSPVAAMGDLANHRYGLQFHPEVVHTPQGGRILRNFLYRVCGCQGAWTIGAFMDESLARLRERIQGGRVICGLSGGVDSAVVAALLHEAIGDRLTCIFVDHGLLRLGEAEQVVEAFERSRGLPLVAVRAAEEFLADLQSVTDPEEKRRRVGHRFVRVFEREAARLAAEWGENGARFLAQGTLYPDVIESASTGDTRVARTIKTHHNVGGLPQDIQFELVEPLRWLFKDEVRRVGEALGLPEEIVWRHPFPGPGLAIRCLGSITWDRLETLRRADAIFLAELRNAGLYREVAQAFALLLPVRSVGVMGDGRTYAEVVALRAVTTDDFMTADWSRLPADLLSRAANRIVNEVPGVNRVVYDITSKPPGTIEWE